MASILGIDLGGTKTAIARYDAQTWELQEVKTFPTHAEKDYAHVRDDLLAQIAELRGDDTTAIGIGIPGLVDKQTHVILNMPNIPDSEGEDLKSFLEEQTKLQVAIGNDADAFTLAEARSGAAKGEEVVVGVTFGTGVGGGIVINGEVFRGAHGFAGEIGHMLLKPGEPPFATEDKRGDIEQFLSGTAMGKRCEAASDPSDYLTGEVCSFMHKDLYKEVSWMITSITHLLDPSVIVFGGSAGKSLASKISDIEKELEKWLLPSTPVPRITIGALDDAATRGAAMFTHIVAEA